MILKKAGDLNTKPFRIISLVPSQTELLHYLGLQDETIGITKFCIHPAEWFSTKIRIGGTKKLNIEKIISLNPDLIIANKEENLKREIEALAKNFNIWVTEINNFEDALTMIGDVGTLTAKEQKAAILIAGIKKQFTLFKKNLPPKKTAYLIWKDPYMTVGGDTFISNMLQLAGFKNVFGERLRYPQITIDELQQSACELLFLSSEPYPFSQKHLDELKTHLPAVKIVLVDGEMFSWYGSRLLKVPEYFNKLTSTINATK
ncbi:MAG: helical backbone metal receptor [Ferruginibacter sp.]